MKRFSLEKLEKWSNSPIRKPLVLSGARQVGNTWILKEFGRMRYERVAYVNFERHPEICGVFEGGLVDVPLFALGSNLPRLSGGYRRN